MDEIRIDKLVRKEHVGDGLTMAAIILFFVCLFLLILTTRARATTAVEVEEQALIESAAAIVVGTVSHMESRLEDGRMSTYITVNAEEILKGDLKVGEIVLRQPGGK